MLSICKEKEKWIIVCDEIWKSTNTIAKALNISEEFYISQIKEYGAEVVKTILNVAYFNTKEEAENALQWVESMVVARKLLGENNGDVVSKIKGKDK